MLNLITIGLLFLSLFSGMILAKNSIIRNSKIISKISGLILYALLFFMGFRIGKTSPGRDQFTEIGLISLLTAAATVAGTIVILFILYSIFEKTSTDNREKILKKPGNRIKKTAQFKEPLLLFLTVAAGFISGLTLKSWSFTADSLTAWLLRLLLLFIGINLTKNGIKINKILAHPETIIIPAGTIAGSLIGGIFTALILNVSPGKALSLASGFGWYSLSGVLITDMGSPVLGSAAFMSNILRESLALLLIPVLSRLKYPNIAIGIAGATSMDVTLPLIEKCCGTKAVPLSISNGAVLSLFVPVLVPFFYHIG